MRYLQVLLSFGTIFLVAGCGDDKPLPPSTTNAATSIPADSASSSVPPADTRDSTLVVAGPIIVEHQLDLAAQRDGIVAKIFFDSPSASKPELC